MVQICVNILWYQVVIHATFGRALRECWPTIAHFKPFVEFNAISNCCWGMYNMSFSQCACFRHQYTIIVKNVNFGPLLWTDASPVSKERCVHTVWARRPVLPISPHVMCWWTGWEWANRQIVNVHAADRRAHQLPRKHSPQSAQLEGERQVLFRKVTNFYWAN